MLKRSLSGVALVAVGLFHMMCSFQTGVVNGASMEPSFHSGQVVRFDRRYCRDHPVRRGEIVIRRQDDTVLIKQVYALAGDPSWTMWNTGDGSCTER